MIIFDQKKKMADVGLGENSTLLYHLMREHVRTRTAYVKKWQTEMSVF